MQLDFDLEDIRNHDDSYEVAKKKLESNDFIARVFLWIMKLDSKGKNTVTTRELAEWSNKRQDYCKWALEGLRQCEVLVKIDLKHKSRFYLNKEKNNKEIEEYLKIAKKTLGLK